MEEAGARGWTGRRVRGGKGDAAQTLSEKAAIDESYEKRKMLWKGMAGRSWTELVQQWGVSVVESLQLQK